MSSTIAYSSADGVGQLTLRRPEALNALNGQMIAEIGKAVREASADASVKVLVIRGEGRAFCAGADLDYLADVLKDNASYFDFVRSLNDVLMTVEEAPMPTIAMVHDLALAGGLELLLACDFAVAAEEARIGDQHGYYGLMPGGGSTQRLPRRIGEQRAKEMLFAADWITGIRAREFGLVLDAVPIDELEARTLDLALRFTPRSKRCIGMTKRAVHRGRHLPMREALQQEAHALFEYFTSSPSPHVGLDAFRNRTTPEFPE